MGQGLAALGLDQARGFRRQFLIPVHRHDPGPGPGQQDGGGAAVADAVLDRAGARDDSDLAVQLLIVRFSIRCHVISSTELLICFICLIG